MFKSHPKGLIPAALSNMGERFGYYIMAAVLSLFLCSKFGLSDEKAALIYSVFLAGIYVLSLVGGIIADRTQNYKGTIMTGIIIMALGYVALAIPITATEGTMTGLLVLTCAALILIAFGNGLFKGNLQAIVGQMYDDMEAEAAKKSPEALAAVQGKRDSGFQIFYVFINIGGLVAPFIAPFLRSWWLGLSGYKYVAELPSLCHQLINGTIPADQMANLEQYAQTAGLQAVTPEACQAYLTVFNQGVHFAFIASVIAMLISLSIFFAKKNLFPTPGKKEAAAAVEISAEEKQTMAKEMKQRLYALFAVLGVVIFFWFSFHQNGVSLSFFARDFVMSEKLPAELWQAVNPFFVIVLTPIVMVIFGSLSKRGKEISTPRKIAYGMFIAGLAYAFLAVYSFSAGYPSGEEFKAMDAVQVAAMKAGPWVMIVTYFLLTVAELFISPLGLSFVSKVAPKSMLGLCQGLWLGTTALGNMLLPIGALMYNKIDLWQCWGVFIVVCLISMGVMLSMVKWLERVTK
ncbi:MAG: peptide MFS transporter [Bacteroidales bacterium]|nr:peptide MFS transporter [Candidatus Sodaliphilus fimicaballi]